MESGHTYFLAKMELRKAYKSLILTFKVPKEGGWHFHNKTQFSEIEPEEYEMGSA